MTNSKSNIYIEQFERFRKAYPGTKRGLDEEYDNFRKKHKDWKKVLLLLFPSLEQQISQREKNIAQNEFNPPWKHLTTWLNQRCWTEQTGVIETLESAEQKKQRVQARIERERAEIRRDYGQYYREKSDEALRECLENKGINSVYGWLINEILAKRGE